MVSISLRLAALLSIITSFLLMMAEIYGTPLFLTVLIGIVGMGLGAYTEEHKDKCKASYND